MKEIILLFAFILAIIYGAMLVIESRMQTRIEKCEARGGEAASTYGSRIICFKPGILQK